MKCQSNTVVWLKWNYKMNKPNSARAVKSCPALKVKCQWPCSGDRVRRCLVPEKVISACWINQLPTDRDKIHCLSFYILLPVHWPPSISRPLPRFHVPKKSLCHDQQRERLGILVVGEPKGKLWGGSMEGREDLLSTNTPTASLTQARLTWSCRPPQTSGAPRCSELTADTSGREAESQGDLRKDTGVLQTFNWINMVKEREAIFSSTLKLFPSHIECISLALDNKMGCLFVTRQKKICIL